MAKYTIFSTLQNNRVCSENGTNKENMLYNYKQMLESYNMDASTLESGDNTIAFSLVDYKHGKNEYYKVIDGVKAKKVSFEEYQEITK